MVSVLWLLAIPAVAAAVFAWYLARRQALALCASRERYQLLFESHPQPMVVYDVETLRILAANEAVTRVYGHTPDELARMTIRDFRARHCEGELDHPSWRSPRPIDRVETVHVRRDGSTLAVEVFWHEIMYEGRRARLATAIDLSARKAAEAAACESNERYRQLFENCPAGIYRTTPDGRILMANPALLRMIGYTSFEEIVHLNLERDAIGEGRRAGAFVNKILASGELRSYETNWRHRDGSLVPVREQAVLLQTPDGPVFEGVVQDLTAKRAAEERLRRSEERSRALLEHIVDMICVVGAEGVIGYQSPSVQRILGYAPEDLAGRNGFDFVHPEDVAAVREAFASAITTPGDAQEVEYRFRDSGGGWRLIAGTVKNLTHEPAVGGIVLNCRDVTESKRAQRELECAAGELARKNVELNAALAQARDATEAKSRFLANMSHEIRTPIYGVLGMTDLLLASELTTEQSEYVQGLRCSADALLGVINDILDISKIESGRIVLESIPFSPSALASDVAMVLRVQALRRGLSLQCETSGEIPPLVLGDPTRIRQTLLNLAGNAVKFTHAGHVKMTVTSRNTESGQATLLFAVEDTGIGISADQKRHLFQKFCQLDSSTTRLYGGTGLGLAISRELIHLMGGNIGCDSEPGRGSTFWFEVTLPVCAREALPDTARSLTASNVGPCRILVAEDNETNRRMLLRLLNSAGHEVLAVTNGVEAVRAVSSTRFDLVLMDVQMPEMDGLAATASIRRLESILRRRTPVIALTASSMKGDREKCLGAGMDDYLAKPVSREEMLTKVNGWIARTGGAAAKPPSDCPDREQESPWGGASQPHALLRRGREESRGSAHVRD
jgi:PAS domain S-box-containing protein